MRRKLFFGAIITFLVLLLAMLLVPFVFEKQLDSRIRAEVNNRLNAGVNYHNFSLSLFRNFPNLNLSAEDISIMGLAKFKGDTLALIKRIDISISWKSMLMGTGYSVADLAFDEPNIKAVVNPDGTKNWDILKESPANGGGGGPVTPFLLELKYYTVQNAVISYADKRSATDVKLYNLNLHGNLVIKNDDYNVVIQTRAFDFAYQAKISSQQTASGSVSGELHCKTAKNDIIHKNFEAIPFSGVVSIYQLHFANQKNSNPLLISNSHVSFTQNSIILDSLNFFSGKNGGTINGTIGNYIPYVIDKGDLTGDLKISSQVFNVDAWLRRDTIPVKEQTQAQSKPANNMPVIFSASAKPSYFKVPSHVDLNVSTEIKKVVSDKIVVEDLTGKLLIKDEAVSLTDVSGSLLAGTAILSAVYNSKNTDNPEVNFDYAIKGITIQQAYNSIKAISEVAPGIKYVSGNCSGNIKGSCKLKPDMNVDYNSLSGNGKLYSPDVKISELPLLTQISSLTKIASLQNLEVKNAETTFAFKKGRMILNPTGLKFTNGYAMYLQGSSGFNQTLDYDMKLDVPAQEAVSSSPLAQNILSFLPGLASNLPKTMAFTFKVNGKADKPVVKLINMAPVNGKQ